MANMYAGGDFELVWPRDLLRTELALLINAQNKLTEWPDRVELLLEDAFASNVPRDLFSKTATPKSSDPGAVPAQGRPDEQKTFLVNLLRHVDDLREPAARVPYWSERRSGVARGAISIAAAARDFERVVKALDDRAYFEEAFEKDCVDDPATVVPAELLESLTGRPNLWPIKPAELAADRDAFFDLIEALHDLVSRPRSRGIHSYAGCGYHHSDFSRQGGRQLYAWRVNRILDRSELEVRLATDGEDAGRLVDVTDDSRSDLVHRMIEREDEATGDRVRHAIALFRSRSATEHDKRSAVVALALVLEERRALLKQELLSKDEGTLFRIANEFAIRHQDGKQQKDYDPVFRDWVYWWYLATIELADRLLERGASTDQPGQGPTRGQTVPGRVH